MITPCRAIAQPTDQPPYEVSLSSFWDGNENALVRIEVSDDPSSQHIPSTIVLVLDESGSMALPAVHHDDSDGNSGLSQLDVVKHASFMTPENKQLAKHKIESLQPESSTNLYDGLQTALEMIRTDSRTPANANIMLLTDGMPNIRPPRGELETLQRYLDAHPKQREVKISTFGFGYSLMSRLLSDIARVGGSIYAFIPDSSFVGTIFINAMANLLSVAAPTGATLKLEATDDVEIIDCLSGQKFSKTSWGMTLEIASIMYGQSIDVLVQLGSKSHLMDGPLLASFEMSTLDKILVSQTKLIGHHDTTEYLMMKKAQVRSALVRFVKEAELDQDPSTQYRDLAQSRQLLERAKTRVNNLCDGIDLPEVTDLRKDIDGQVTEAYSTTAFYQKWGRHYILSLAGAHTLQQCINFKDPGIQQYATAKFQILRDTAEEIFVKLKPPKPSRKATVPVLSMHSYCNSNAPCFAAGNVVLANGETIPISQVRAGQVVKTSNGLATILCIVETPSENGIENLVELDEGVLVTPWHPVRRCAGNESDSSNNRWVFPCFLAEARPRPCTAVYSFVLGGDVSMRIGPYDCIALGHGLTEEGGQTSKVLQHEYFGTERVISDLSQMKGWSFGHVRLAPNPAIRNPATSRVVALCQEGSNKTAKGAPPMNVPF